MSVLSQELKVWFVKKEVNDRRHGLFMRTPDGETLHIHISPYNIKRMVHEKWHVEARGFIRTPESSAESVISAAELIEELKALANKNSCALSDLDVVFDETEVRINRGDKVLDTLEFDDDDNVEPSMLVAALKDSPQVQVRA